MAARPPPLPAPRPVGRCYTASVHSRLQLAVSMETASIAPSHWSAALPCPHLPPSLYGAKPAPRPAAIFAKGGGGGGAVASSAAIFVQGTGPSPRRRRRRKPFASPGLVRLLSRAAIAPRPAPSTAVGWMAGTVPSATGGRGGAANGARQRGDVSPPRDVTRPEAAGGGRDGRDEPAGVAGAGAGP